jgi:hypothetical protein
MGQKLRYPGNLLTRTNGEEEGVPWTVRSRRRVALQKLPPECWEFCGLGITPLQQKLKSAPSSHYGALNARTSRAG